MLAVNDSFVICGLRKTDEVN